MAIRGPEGCVFETPIGQRAQTDWEREVTLAAATISRNEYTAPRTMMWDGVANQPDHPPSVHVNDLFCFVMRGYASPGQESEVAVYRVTSILGLNEGRVEWLKRDTRAILLEIVGFIRHDRYRALLGRSPAVQALQRTQRCKGAIPTTVLTNLDVTAREITRPMHLPSEVENGFVTLPCDVPAFLTEHLIAEGDPRVWTESEDVLEYLKFSGLCGTEPEREAWLHWLQACNPGFWDDNSNWLSIDDDIVVDQEIVEELELIDMTYDFEDFIDESWKRYFRCAVKDDTSRLMAGAGRGVISRETDHLRGIGSPCLVDDSLPVAGTMSAETIKAVYNIDALDSCNIVGTPPLRGVDVSVSILKCVLDDDNKLSYIIGYWAGGKVFIPKTMATAIVNSQRGKCYPDYKYCEQQALGRVSTDYYRTVKMSVYEKPEDVRFPWRAYWVNC